MDWIIQAGCRILAIRMPIWCKLQMKIEESRTHFTTILSQRWYWNWKNFENVKQRLALKVNNERKGKLYTEYLDPALANKCWTWDIRVDSSPYRWRTRIFISFSRSGWDHGKHSITIASLQPFEDENLCDK